MTTKQRDPNERRTGAFRQTTHAHSLRSVLQAMIEEDPDPISNKDEILERMYAHYRKHVEMYEHGVVVDYWGENNFNALVRQRSAPSIDVHRRRQARAQAAAVSAVQTVVTHKAVRMLLDEIVPVLNKPLRDCTIAECRNVAGQVMRWCRLLTAIGQSEHVGTVGEHFTEDQLQAFDQQQ